MRSFHEGIGFAALLLLLSSHGASAQNTFGQAPVTSAQVPICARLEGQLAAIDRGFVDPARADHIRRFEDVANKQQFDLDRAVAQSRQLGCEGLGLFSIFSSQNPQCPRLNQQIQQMRGNLDKTLNELQKLRGNTDREPQRQTVIAALAQNNCGPQYRNAANQQPGFFETLFGNQGGFGGGFGSPPPGVESSFRTVCVRTCDGYYFPVSFATTPDKFAEDEQTCQRMCPASEAVLASHRNPGEDINQAITNNGIPYTELPNAFKYRREYSSSCSCQHPGQNWSASIGQAKDNTIERGDIVITEERAKALSQPRDARGRAIQQNTTANPGARLSVPRAPATENKSSDTKKTIRTVGPPFVPAQ